MTSNLPESIISKIMLYNSHPIADILKASWEFRLKRQDINRYCRVKCSFCLEGMCRNDMYVICFKCRANGIENYDELCDL